MAEFVMPTLGADMEAGTLIEWRKKVGDHVAKGEIIAEVDTEKAAIEVESFATGIVDKLLIKPGDKVAVGTVMAIIREEGRLPTPPVEAAAAPQAGPPPPIMTLRPHVPLPVGPGTMPEPEPGRLRISPAARKLAAELGVDASLAHGTGPDGAITIDDIQRAAQEKVAGAGGRPEVMADRQARMRQTIAAAMARSKREIPHYYLSTTIDMSRATGWLTETNSQQPVTDRLLYGVLLIKAVALALRQIPELNAVWKGTEPVRSSDIHVGVAISLRQGGLIAPALHHADQQSLVDLMKRFQDLVKRARSGTLRSSELSDPTITVTSLGEQGVETVFGVIYPPQVALVGFGKLVQRPWIVEGQVVSRSVITATLSADHRVSDGHRGGLFLAAIDRLLQEPDKL